MWGLRLSVVCVSRHIQYSPLGCDSVKPIIFYTETILVYRLCHIKHVNIMCRHNADFLVFNLAVNTQDYWFTWQIPFVVSCQISYCTEPGCRSQPPSPPCRSEGLNVHSHRQSSVAWWWSSRWRWVLVSSERNATSQNDVYILFCRCVSCSVGAPRIIGPIYFWDYKFTPMRSTDLCHFLNNANNCVLFTQGSYDRIISKELCPCLQDIKLYDFELCGTLKDRACSCNHRIEKEDSAFSYQQAQPALAVTSVCKPNRIVYSTFCNSDE
jgi:hypothetical protein